MAVGDGGEGLVDDGVRAPAFYGVMSGDGRGGG